jgi:hypothetical protein
MDSAAADEPDMTTEHMKIMGLAVILGALLTPMASLAEEGRVATVYYSDGNSVTGRISLTEGRLLKLNIPQGGSTKTTDMVTGEDVQYGKARTFGLDVVKTIEFVPEKEEMRQDWRFTEKKNVNKDGWVPAAKEFSGPEYPIRYVKARVILTSSEKIEGHLYTTLLYIENKDTTRKIVLRSKERGEKEQTLEDLVYVTRIVMLDAGKEAYARMQLALTGTKFASGDAASAVTVDTLTPVTTKVQEGTGVVWVDGAFGEEVYIAVRIGKEYRVGWPAGRDDEMWKLVEDHVKRQRDFYNEKTLLGVTRGENDGEMLSLVSLRRKVSPTHFGEIGGEWDKASGGVVEPWRLSIWRWKYDKKNHELSLVSRGTFFRVIFKPVDPTPSVVVSSDLWNIRAGGGAAAGEDGKGDK